MAQFQFDATNVTPDSGRQPPVPKGNYRAMMVASEIKPTSNGTGYYIAGQFKLVGAPYDGHIIHHNFNVKNQSEKATEIGYAQLSAVMHAVGILNIQDTSQLHNRILEVSVKINSGDVKVPANPATGQAEERYEDRNEITAFKKDSGQAAPAAASTFVLPPAAAPQAPAAPTQFAPPPALQGAPAQPWAQAPAAAPAAAPQPWAQQPPAAEQPAWANANPVQAPAVTEQAPAAPTGPAPWQQGAQAPAAPAQGQVPPPWAQQPAQ